MFLRVFIFRDHEIDANYMFNTIATLDIYMKIYIVVENYEIK